jgi:hypothetical protein
MFPIFIVAYFRAKVAKSWHLRVGQQQFFLQKTLNRHRLLSVSDAEMLTFH